jgi:hypothetical protein
LNIIEPNMKTMRNLKIIIIAIITFSPGFIQAQEISSALGRLDTDFKFYSDSISLEVSSQFIIKKAGTFQYVKSRTSDSDGWGYGYGFGGGYESYHLEFVTTSALVTEEKKHVDHKYIVEFIDASKNILASETIESNRVSHFYNQSIAASPHFYSFDLISIPISLLDRTSEIHIMEVKPKKRAIW